MLPIMFSCELNSMKAAPVLKFLDTIQEAAKSAGVTQENSIYVEIVDNYLKQAEDFLRPFTVINAFSVRFPLLKLGVGNISHASQIDKLSQFANISFFSLPQAGFSDSSEDLNLSLMKVVALNNSGVSTFRELIFQAGSKAEVQKIEKEFGLSVIKFKVHSDDLPTEKDNLFIVLQDIIDESFSKFQQGMIFLDAPAELGWLWEFFRLSSDRLEVHPYVSSIYATEVNKEEVSVIIDDLIRTFCELS